VSLSILVSESEEKWSKEITISLENRSYSVEHAHNGKDCQLKIYKNKYLAVVLDLDTRNHSGLEVLRYLRLNAPSVKVILSIQNQKKLKDLELSREELRKLGASDILIKPYSLDMLLQSVEGANQLEAWKDIKGSGPQKEEETIEADDNDFTRIKIEDFYSGNATIFDCYVKLSKNKYVKILHKGDFFDEKRIEKYKEEHTVSHLYFKTKERAIYINFINSVLEKMLTSRKDPIEKKVRTAKSLTEKFVEEIYTVGLKPQLIDEGKKICQNIYNIIQRNPDLANLLEKYEDYDPPAYAHLFLVSFMSVIICKNLEWSSQRTVELIAFGALLHDIGKLKLPEELKELSVDEMSVSQFELYMQHPLFGAEMLQNYPVITEPIRQIVYQHHEYVNGEGFPNGLTGIKIYPLAKVVALADGFSSILTKRRVPPLVALRDFVPDREKILRYDPLIVRALIKGFVKEGR